MFLRELLRAPAPGLPVAIAPRRAALITVTLIALSGWINVAIPLLGAGDLVGAASPLLGIAGAILSFRSWRVGLVLSALAPVLASAAGRDPAGTGILCIFTALLLALRGASPLLVGGVVTLANLIAALSHYGLTEAAGRWPSVVVLGAALTAAIGAAVRSRAEVRDGQEQHERDVRWNQHLTVQNAVAEERIRIARDLHDSIGHGIAVISMHVGTAEMTAQTTDVETQESLRAARTAIKSVLEETQHTLQMLRVPSDASSFGPITGPHALTEMIESFQTAGLRVHCRIDEPLVTVPDRIRAAVFRIAQEMLTNAQRHAAGEVTLRIQHTGDVVTITSRNAVGRAEAAGGGHGLVGMRERAESLGGSLSLRSTDDVFEVTATILVPHAEVES
ncbi:sensor histidine kinase [Marisediminicola sp. LYQ134]|uniref:sensor histidine kinase n=1 Tax=unclassified Marisediminicola TaxID=2618316 RepID=UPI0039832FB5